LRKGIGAQPDLFQTAPAIAMPKSLSSKAVEQLQRLLIEAIHSGLAEREEKDDQEGGDDHNHG
jgi:hypothetical protein